MGWRSCFQRTAGESGQGPIPQGLRQILMASFRFGAKEPQRDFGLDPGSWNKNVFFISGQGPIPQGLQQILMTSFFSGAKEHQRDFGLDPGSWNKNVFFISGQGPIPQGLQQILMTSFFSGAKEHQRDFGLDPGSWNKNLFFSFQGRGPFHRVFNGPLPWNEKNVLIPTSRV